MAAPLERRVMPSRVELRAAGENRATIAGYGAVFHKLSQNLGGFVERISPTAFTKTLRESDVRALVNHDPNWIIGRSTAGSLRLEADDEGLRYEVDVDTTDADGARAASKIGAGLIDGSSFGFRVIADEWGFTDQGMPLRTLHEVELRDVGPATFPAYLDTTVAARALGTLADSIGRPVDELVAAGERGELRALIENDDETNTGKSPEPDTQSTPLLDLARRRHAWKGRRHSGAARNAPRKDDNTNEGESHA